MARTTSPKPDEIRFRKVSTGMWGDKKFRALSKPPPNGQSLWQWLITGPRTTQIPGIVTGSLAVLAAEIGWSVEGFTKAFEEASSLALAKGDFEAGLILLPKACIHNKPASPNVIRSWRWAWKEIPECDLKIESWQTLKAFAKEWGEAWVEAFEEACPRPFGNQEQEQERDQEGEQEQEQKQEGEARTPVDNSEAPGDERRSGPGDISREGSPPKDPSRHRNGSASRSNGDFEAINEAVSKLLAAGVCKPGDYRDIARLAHVSVLQAEISVRQLRDRGRLPAVAA